jgi:hypothetical protein
MISLHAQATLFKLSFFAPPFPLYALFPLFSLCYFVRVRPKPEVGFNHLPPVIKTSRFKNEEDDDYQSVRDEGQRGGCLGSNGCR